MELDSRIFVAPIACIVIGLVWVVWVVGRRCLRRRAFAQLAKELGLDYLAKPPVEVNPEEDGLIRRGFGTGLAIKNFMTGLYDGFAIEISDQIQSQMLSSQSTMSHTVIELTRHGLRTPEFILQPESKLSWSSHLVEGKSGMKFGDDLTFSMHNYLRGPQPAEIMALFTEEVRGLLRGNEALWIQGTGNSYRFYECGHIVPVRDIRAMLDRVMTLTRLFCDIYPPKTTTPAETK
jgi:hypothetical protein